MRPRTKRQQQIMKFINDFITDHGYKPSYQQIANHLGVKSKGGVAKHIEALEKLGLLERTLENGSFHLSLISKKTTEELICEIEWFTNPNNYNKHEQDLLYVPRSLVGFISPNNMRAITVMDNSMLNRHIREDDIALIESKTFVRDGEIVAALVEKTDIVLRKYYRLGSEIELVPDNDNYETLLVSADKLQIIGIYRSLIRPYI